MKIFDIAYYTFKRSFRDIKSLGNMILLPIILILILGNALGGVFSIGDIGKTKVVYLNHDKGVVSQNFELFLEEEQIQEILEIKKAKDYKEGIKAVKEEEVSALIYIEKDYSEKIHSGQKAKIKVIGAQYSMRTAIVRNVVNSFQAGANAILAKNEISKSNGKFIRKDVLTEVPLSAKGKIPRAIDYYAVTMLVLIIMYGSLYGLHGISEDYLEQMKNRLLITPVSLFKHFTGKAIGTVVVVYLQTLILIVFTKLVYNVNWGNNPFEILFIALTLTVFSITMGMAVGIFAKDRKVGTVILYVFINVMTFISGGFVRIISDSPVYKGIKMALPSSLGHSAFFNSIYGEFAGQTVSSVAILWFITLSLLGIAVTFGRRRFN